MIVRGRDVGLTTSASSGAAMSGLRTPGMRMMQETSAEWAEPCLLPRLEKLLGMRSDIPEAAGWILDPNDYRSPVDHVLAAFVPGFRQPIAEFYARGGVPLRLLVNRSSTAKIDQRLTVAIPSACDSWAAFKRAAESAGISTKRAASAFVSTMAPLVAFPPVPSTWGTRVRLRYRSRRRASTNPSRGPRARAFSRARHRERRSRTRLP